MGKYVDCLYILIIKAMKAVNFDLVFEHKASFKHFIPGFKKENLACKCLTPEITTC